MSTGSAIRPDIRGLNSEIHHMTAKRGLVALTSVFFLASAWGPQPSIAQTIELAQAPKGPPASEGEQEKGDQARKKSQEKRAAPPPSAPPTGEPTVPRAAPPPARDQGDAPRDRKSASPPPPPPDAPRSATPRQDRETPVSPRRADPTRPEPRPPTDRGPPPPERKSVTPAEPPAQPPGVGTRSRDVGKEDRGGQEQKDAVPPARKAEPVAPQPKSPANTVAPTPELKSVSPPVSPGAPPAAATRAPEPPKSDAPGPAPGQGVATPSPKDGGPAPAQSKGQPPGASPPAIVETPPKQPDRLPRAAEPQPRMEELKSTRTQRVEDGGKRTVIQEPGPGNRVIIKQDNRIIIRHDESERFRRVHRDARTERRSDGTNETFYVRPDGVRVVSIVDADGRIIHRYRRDREGREFSIIDNRRFMRNAGIAVGVGAVGLAIALNLPPPTVRIPRELYIVNDERSSEDDLYEALSAPPVETLERSYSLEEIRYTYELRQRMRRVDLDTITFEFGSWQITDDQRPKLERVARALRRLLVRNPDEVFLIAAHTDAVGADVDNLSLSDRRAESVAQILSEEFGLPTENFVTQGYGEQHLKIGTQGPEARNRRVEVQRITPLLAQQ